MSHIAENAFKRYHAATKICAAAMSIIQQYREADGTPPELLVKYLEAYVETYAPIFWEELKQAETGYAKLQRRAMEEIEDVRKHIPQHSNGAKPAEICPWCCGDGSIEEGTSISPSIYECEMCRGSGKLRHC